MGEGGGFKAVQLVTPSPKASDTRWREVIIKHRIADAVDLSNEADGSEGDNQA